MAQGVKRTIGLYINGTEVKSEIKDIKAAMTHLVNEQNRMTIGSDQYVAHAKKIRELKSIINEHNNALKVSGNLWDTFSKRIVMLGAGIGGWIETFQQLNQTAMDLKKLATDLAAMDDVYASVQKYANLTRDEVLQLNEEFKKMDTRTSREELNRLAGEAGKLGIEGVQNLKDFVAAADIIQISLGEDLGEDAVKQMGKLAEMFDLTKVYGYKDGMLKVASAINQVGQSSTAAESYLLDFTNRLSGVANQAGISVADIIGYGSVLDQNAQQVEMSATALNKFIIQMVNKTESVANAAGIPVKELNDLIGKDMNAALLRVFEGLNKKGGLKDLAPLFKDLGAEGARAASVIAILSEKYDTIIQGQQLSNKAFEDGNSVLKEFNTNNNNLNAELEKSKKKFQDQRLELGEKFYPVLLKITKGSTGLIKAIGMLSTFISENKGLILILVAAYSKYLIAGAKFLAFKTKEIVAEQASIVSKKLSNVVTNLSTLRLYYHALAHDLAAKKITLHAAAQEALRITMLKLPWTAILVAITAIVYAIAKWGKETSVLQKNMGEMTVEISQQKTEAKKLLSQLAATTKGSEERERIIQKITEKYGVYRDQLIDEKNNLKNLDVVLGAINQKLEEQIRLKFRNNAVDEIYEKQGKKVKKSGERVFENIQQQITDLDKAGEAMSELRELMDEENIIKDEIFTSNAGQVYVSYTPSDKLTAFLKKYNVSLKNGLDKNIYEYQFYNKQLNDEINKAEILFGESEKTQLSEMESLEKQLAELNKKFVDAKTAAGKIQYAKEITALEKLIEDKKKLGDKEINNNNELTDEEKAELKKREDAWKSFYEKQANFRAKQQIDQLTDFEKEKASITYEYDQMIKEALEFGERGKKIAGELEKEKGEAIIAAGQKYLVKYNEVIQKIYDSAEKRLGSDNPLLEKLKVSDTEWNKIINDYKDILNELEILYSETQDPQEAEDVRQTMITTWERMNEAIRLKSENQINIIKDAQGEITDALKTETERQIDEVKNKYDLLIKLAQTSMDELVEIDPVANAELIEKLKKQIEELKKKLGEEIEVVLKKEDDKSGIAGLFTIDWDNFLNDWKTNLQKIIAAVEEAYRSIGSIMNSVTEIQNNNAESELNKYKEVQEGKLDTLQERYDKGLISEAYYNSQKQKIEEETDAKEKQIALEQWKRSKALASSQAAIQGALAIVSTFAQLGFSVEGVIAAALCAASTVAEIAAIQSEPAPYARGGYVKKETVYKAGEQGEEWVASHSLLKDKKTAGIISELEAYQRGSKSIFNTVSVPNQKNMSQAASSLSRSFVTSQTPVVNNYYQNNSDNETIKKMYNKVEEFTKYMSDPKNRRASVDRKLLTEFDSDETFLRNKSVL